MRPPPVTWPPAVRARERRLHRLVRRRVDQRPDERAFAPRIADLHLAVCALEACHQLAADTLVRDEAAQRRAALPAGSDGAEEHSAHREIEIRRRRHDHRIVAAELEQRSTEARRDTRSDGSAHARRAGGADQRYAMIIDEQLADLRVADDHLGEPVGCGSSGLREACAGSAEERLTGERGERRLLRRLPHHRVAAHGSEREVPGPDRDRKVERADHANRAERMPCLGHAMPRTLRRDRQSVELSRKTTGEVADVDHLLHFAARLGHDLAGLDGHDGGQRVLVRAQLLTEQANELSATRRRHRPPRQERGVGAADRRLDRLRVGGLHARGHRAVDRRPGDELASARGGKILRVEARGS